MEPKDTDPVASELAERITQLEADVAAGRLDRFAQEAIADFQAGRSKDL